MGEGITVMNWATEEKVQLSFGQQVSDVVQKLGNPNKEHSSVQQNEDSDRCYFLNYLEFGFDLAFSAKDHLLKKIMLRCNQLVDPNFGFYDRCHFSIPVADKGVDINPQSLFTNIRPLLVDFGASSKQSQQL